MDKYLVGQFEKLSISKTEPNEQYDQYNNNSQKQKLLCVDILNYSKDFLNLKDHWDLEFATKNVKKFVDSCRENGFYIEIFIDARMKTDEALKTWRDRRENEVLNEPSKVPANLSKIIGELFFEKGVKIHYSLEEDNDDTIATYAYLKDGYILSGDKDFLCYDQKFKLYKSFYYDNGKLYFINQDNYSWKIGKIFRKVLNSIPKTSTNWVEYTLGLNKDNYLRGCPTALIKFFDSPHNIVKELRLALFNYLKLTNIVFEEYPSYRGENKVIWNKNKVNPSTYNKDYISLLEDPAKPLDFYKNYFVNDLSMSKNNLEKITWGNHLFSLFSIILELCSVASKDKYSLVALLRKFKPMASDYISKMNTSSEYPTYIIQESTKSYQNNSRGNNNYNQTRGKNNYSQTRGNNNYSQTRGNNNYRGGRYGNKSYNNYNNSHSSYNKNSYNNKPKNDQENNIDNYDNYYSNK